MTALDLSDRPQDGVPSYSLFQRMAHWLTLLLLIALYTLAWSNDDSLPKDLHHALVQWHRSLGVTLWLLTAARLAYRFGHGVPPEPAMLRWQQIAARSLHWLLYTAMLLEPLLGYISTNLEGRAVPLFVIDLPVVTDKNRALSHVVMGMHSLTANVILGLAGLHAAAALYHHYVRQDGVLLRMLRG